MRRRELIGVAGAAWLGAAATSTAQPTTGRLVVGEAPDGHVVPEDFIGLSYECQELADPAFFAPSHSALVRAFRQIAPRGVLRLGGNTSEFSWWRESAGEAAPARRAALTRVGEPRADTLYAITPTAIDALSGFLRAADWRCIYGLNLGRGEPAALAREAAYVQRALGDRLLMFALGNEPDQYRVHLRDPASWSVEHYLDEWLPAAHAVLAAAPGAHFSLPEVAGALDWLAAAAERLSRPGTSVPVAAVSHHFYFGGPPSNPDVNVTRLLQPDPRVAAFTAVASAAAARVGARPRLTEANTCYRGGKPGVSDAYASALWAADLALELMAAGYEGLHLHGGSASAVSASVGGLAGDALHTDDAPHPRPYYTPIAQIGARLELQPDAQGLRFAGLFAGARMLPCALEVSGMNVTTYAARRRDGAIQAAVVNKDATRTLALAAPRRRQTASLTGTALESREARLRMTPAAALQGGDLVVPPLCALAFELA